MSGEIMTEKYKTFLVSFTSEELLEILEQLPRIKKLPTVWDVEAWISIEKKIRCYEEQANDNYFSVPL